MVAKITKFFSTSLQRKLTLLLVIIVVVVMAAVSRYWVVVQANIASAELYNKADRMSLLLKRTLSIPLWNLKVDLMEEQLEAVMADHEVLSVEIYESGVKEPLLLKQRKDVGSGKDVIERTAEIVYELDGESIKLGQLRIVYTQRYLQDRVSKLRLAMTGIVMLLIAALFLGTYFIVKQMVELPVKQITRMLDCVTSGDLDQVLDIQRDDEIGILAQAVNAMTAQLRELYSNLEQRVVERTADLQRRSLQLEAAAQVARQAAMIRDLGELLDETVLFISKQFDFYHAGIFLLDEVGEYAVLRAASSKGGQRMLARRHKLEIGQVGIVGYVAGKGEARIALDVGEDVSYFDNPDLPQTRSEMALPLKVRGQIIGVLDVQSVDAQAFTEEDVAILQVLGDQIALAVENARLFEDVQTQLQEMGNLLSRHSQEGWQHLVAERPLWGYVYDGVDVVSRDAARSKEPQSVSRSERQMTVPLDIRGESIGHLDMVMADRPFVPDEVDLIKAVVEQVGAALENARLFQETQRTIVEVEMLYRTSRAIGAASSVREVEQALLDYADLSALDVAYVLLFEHDAQGHPVHLVIGEGWVVDNQSLYPSGTRLAMSDHPFVGSMRSDETVIMEDVFADSKADEAIRNFASFLEVRSLALLPISVGEHRIGLVFIGRREPAGFAGNLIRGYLTLAAQAAVVIEGLRLLQMTKYQAEQERLIGQVTAHVRETLDVDTVLQNSVRVIGEMLDMTRVEVRLAAGPMSGKDRDDVEQGVQVGK